MTPSYVKPFIIFTCIILTAWFLLGFVVPLLVVDLQTSAAFGDAFGSANALFSGIGLLAIAYTIVLQLDSMKEQKREARFTLLLKLVEEIKADLDSVRYETDIGINAIVQIRAHLTYTYFDLKKLRPALRSLFRIEEQLISTLQLIESHKHQSLDEYSLAINKASLIYIAYLDELDSRLAQFQLRYHDQVFESLKESSARLRQKVRRIIQEDTPVQ